MGLSKYEGMFLLDTSRSAKDWDKVVGHVEDILKKNGAEIQSSEKWGERKLAYPIGHHKRAVYLLVVFLCPGPAIGRIRRACQLSDAIVRVLITVFDEKAKIVVEPELAVGAPREGAPAAEKAPKGDDGLVGEPQKTEDAGKDEAVKAVEPETDDEAPAEPKSPDAAASEPEKEDTKKGA